MPNIFQLTVEGKKKLEDELEYLKTVERPRNIEALKEARSQGDLSENADYDAARDEQTRIESRIFEIENILKNHKIIASNTGDAISIGHTVKFVFLNTNEEETLTIVGTIESDPINKKISNESPLGKTLIGHKKDEVLTVEVEDKPSFKIKVIDFN